MKISLNWLKQYLNLDLDYKKVSEILTDIGLEVENIEKYQSIKGGLNGLVVGEILTKEKHPNADKLSVTTVNIGTDNYLPIVCGAPNVEAGQKVVVATLGTVLYLGEKELKIKRSKIRGAESQGMICAEDEIGLGSSHEGIIVLDQKLEVGTPASEIYHVENDIIFEIGLTPNRIDGASHIGVARDLAAYIKHNIADKYSKVSKPSVDKFEIDNNDNIVDIQIDNTKACRRYSGLTISGVSIDKSPNWLKNRLEAIGLKPINNIVDITNYVLHETGQPLHAFDADMIDGKKIIIKTLDDKTKFISLDEEERELSSEDLMICNAKEGMCIAGVFGGFKSGVSQNTKNIFLESANFDPVYVRKTSKRHMLVTDSSFRFERGADPNMTVYALKRASMLIKELAGGKISSNIIDIYPNKIENLSIDIFYKHINRLIGKTIEKNTVKNILESLDFVILEENDTKLKIEIPKYRFDVTREADVIEEILRIYGYNNVEISTDVKSTISYAPKPDENKQRLLISEFLSSKGFNEAMSNSLTKSSYYDDLESFSSDETVRIINPLSLDLNAMRQSLLFGGLESIEYNLNRKASILKLYEFGYSYKLINNSSDNVINKYNETHHLSIFIAGNKLPINWNYKEDKTSFYEIKSVVNSILQRLNFNIDLLKIEEIANDIFSYGLKYTYNNKHLVDLGFVKPEILEKSDIDIDVFYADFNWDNVLKTLTKSIRFKEISKYPKVKRDLALLIDKSINFKEIKDIAYKTERKLLKNVDIFDIYEGEKLGNDKKSYAISFILQDDIKTLKDKQIDKIMNKLIANYENKLGAKIR